MAVRPFERQPGSWQYDYHDAYGHRRWGTASDENTALIIQAKKQNEYRLVKAGVLKPEQVAQASAKARPIETDLTEYEEHLRSKGDSQKHIKNTMGALRRAIKWLGVGIAEDITIDGVETLFNRKMEAGMGARMRNFYTKALKAFLQLLEDRDIIAKNRLRRLRSLNEEVDPKNVSRPMTHEQFTAVITSLETVEEEEGVAAEISGKGGGVGDGEEKPWTEEKKRRMERRLFYLFVARTGMRWAETGRLWNGDIDRVAWWLQPRAKNTKAKRADALPIPTDLVDALTAWRKQFPDPKPTDTVFPSGVPTLRTWKRDLVRAKVIFVKDGKKYAGKKKKGKKAREGYRDVYAHDDQLQGYADDRGAKFDRKCLRLTFGHWLYEAGVDIREAQRLMRHHDINLTSKIYTRPRMSNLVAAAEKVAAARTPAAPAAATKKGAAG